MGPAPAELRGYAMNMIDAVASVFRQYATFSGRARRAEYWWFALFDGLIITVMAIAGGLLSAVFDPYATEPSPSFYAFIIAIVVYSLAVLIPRLAVTVRRLHDSNHSGAYYFLSFIPWVGGLILLIFLVMPGTRGSNMYGLDPRQPDFVPWSPDGATPYAGSAQFGTLTPPSTITPPTPPVPPTYAPPPPSSYPPPSYPPPQPPQPPQSPEWPT